MKALLWMVLLPLAPVASGCENASQACTLLDCEEGIRIAFSYGEPGTYVFEVTVDGETTTCSATLPLEGAPANLCDRSGVRLTVSGSELPSGQQSIGGLSLDTKTAEQLRVVAMRDGAPLAELDVVPEYEVRPGPNGPGCEPETCTLATHELR